MKILCASDFQIGAGRTVGITLDDQHGWLQQIVAIARDNRADLFLGLGDAFHSRSTTRDQDEVFLRFLVAMAETCPVLWVNGNHDWRGYGRASTTGIFREMGVTLALEPAVHRFGDVSIACLPWASVGHLVAAQDGGDRAALNQAATGHLVTIAGGLRSQIAETGDTAILAAHWSVSGATLPTGLPVEQIAEPVVELADLEAQEWDAIALGHVHKGQLCASNPQEPELPVFYCGSPYACDWGEADFAHGAWLLETHKYGARHSFIPLDGPRLETLDFEGDDPATEPPYEIAEALVMDAIIRARIHLTSEQARHFDAAAFKRSCCAAGARFVSVQLDIEKPERGRIEGLTEELDEIAALVLWLEASGINGTRAELLRDRTERYLERIR